jgi:hypothetical protein
VPPDYPVCQRSNNSSATVDSNGNLKSATVRGQCAQSHWTVNSDCPVHHRTVRWPRLSELQRSNPNSWVTWLAHRTVFGGTPDSVWWRTGLSGAPIDSSPTPTVGLVFGAIDTPNHHHFKASKFSDFTFNTRASAINTRHKFNRIKASTSPKSTPSK